MIEAVHETFVVDFAICDRCGRNMRDEKGIIHGARLLLLHRRISLCWVCYLKGVDRLLASIPPI